MITEKSKYTRKINLNLLSLGDKIRLPLPGKLINNEKI